MLIFESTTKKNWVIKSDKINREYPFILLPGSLTNAYKVIPEMVQEMDDLNVYIELNGKDIFFSDWIESLLWEYIDSERNSEILIKATDTFLKFAENYIDNKKVDFKSFVNKRKTTKTSILFTEEDIREIAIASTALKIYGIFYNESSLKPPEDTHKKIFKLLTNTCFETGVLQKVFLLLKSRTYRTYSMDKYMWQVCKLKISETPDSHIMSIYNFLISSLFVILDVTINPIPFINNIIDSSISWLMRTSYNIDIIYGEIFSGTNDIYGSSHSQQSFYVHACNDVIGKSSAHTLDIIKNHYQLTDYQYDSFQSRLEQVDEIFPYMKLFNIPFISSLLEIPYKHLITTHPRHIMLLSIFSKYISEDVLDKKFPNLIRLLESKPAFSISYKNHRKRKLEDLKIFRDKNNKITVKTTKSSYKIRNLQHILNNNTTIFGFENPKLRFDIISAICGILISTKKDLESIITKDKYPKIQNTLLEEEITKFFNLYYSGNLEEEFKEMRNKVDTLFF
jgi:hypothetical protein